MPQDLQTNKKNAIALCRGACEGDPAGAAERYVGDDCIQHHPVVDDGKMVEHRDSIRGISRESLNGNPTY